MALVAPQNYMSQAVQNPFLQSLQGFQMAQQMAAQRDALAAQREEQAQKAQMKADIAAFTEKPNKTIDDYQNLMVKYPDLSRTLQSSFENMNEEQKKNKIGELTTLYGFLSNNKTEDAKSYLDTLRTAYENSGDNAAAISLKSIKNSLDMQPEGPQAALNMAELQLYNAMGKDAFERLRMQQNKAVTGGKAQPVGGGIIIEDPVTKQKKLVTGSFQDGQLSIAGADLPGQLVSRLGETAAQQSERTVQETQQKVQAKSEEERTQGFVNQGLSAAESLPTLKRSLELLDTIKTGGFNKALIGAKQFFGIEAADEGELSYNLSKNVLSQLRTTFGAAFTENEGARLQKIEAGLGRNPATNKAILNNAIKMAQRKVNKAIMIAKKKGDEETVSELKDLMNFTLSPAETKPPPPPTVEKANPIQVQTGEQTATNPQTGEKIVFRNGQWLNINTGAPIQ